MSIRPKSAAIKLIVKGTALFNQTGETFPLLLHQIWGIARFCGTQKSLIISLATIGSHGYRRCWPVERFNWPLTGNDRPCPQDGTLAKCLVLRFIQKKVPPNLLHVNSVFIFVSLFLSLCLFYSCQSFGNSLCFFVTFFHHHFLNVA